VVVGLTLCHLVSSSLRLQNELELSNFTHITPQACNIYPGTGKLLAAIPVSPLRPSLKTTLWRFPEQDHAQANTLNVGKNGQFRAEWALLNSATQVATKKLA